METVYFVHLSDTHIGPTADYERHGYRSLPYAQKIVELIQQLPHRPDFIVHTGDVVTEPDEISYQAAAQTFAPLDIPIYYVTGNHDKARWINHYLPMGPKEDLSGDPDLLSYGFTVKGHRFVAVDGRGTDEIDPHGVLSDRQLEIVAAEVEKRPESLTLFVHYPTWPLNSVWMDNNMLLLNGEKLHQLLLPIRDQVCGVFYGHVHQHIQIVRDGILYSCVGSTFAQFHAWPNDLTPRFVPDPPAFAFVHLTPEQTIIHPHSFDR